MLVCPILINNTTSKKNYRHFYQVVKKVCINKLHLAFLDRIRMCQDLDLKMTSLSCQYQCQRTQTSNNKKLMRNLNKIQQKKNSNGENKEDE